MILQFIIKSLTRLLGSSEWERFDYYASFIRVLLIDHNVSSEWSPSVFTSLHLHQSLLRGDLLPNLRKFRYTRPSKSFHQTPTLLPHSLQVVDLRVAAGDEQWVQSLVSYFPHAFPEIEDVRLSSLSKRGRLPVDIQPLTNCTNLKSLICDLHVSDVETAVQLAGLPKLEALSLTFAKKDPHDGTPPPVLTGPYEFPCVKSLTCNSSSEFLRACHFPVLQSFSISHLSDIRDTLDALAEHCTPHLMRKVEITGYGDYECDISLEHIRGLLKFHDLECVVIDVVDCGFDDEILELMVSSWPNLEKLVIQDEKVNSRSRKNGLTLFGLIPLVRHCPNLTSLSYKFKQKTCVSLSDLPSADDFSNLRLREIQFYDSELGNSQSNATLAKFYLASSPT
ncbi:hypothetical protein NLI96_g9478 [Meripilus lineatus]|uniref:F-box protein n=1 Tax=Meripilus lineatus TaxID=2056292 RepID=A0AAD5YA59_9APHY|nr:hypothetical protein NLI96_g9478 [Physisporinus lineatus]